MSPSANDTIRLGFIGVAGRGYGHLDWFGKHPDVQIAAVCDVHQPHLERAIAKTEGKAQGYHDYRKLLENKDIDAVVIATPPHWHAIMAAEAMQAGKDVYCEKPLSRFPGEIRVMVEYAKRYNRITQDGTQVHASPNYHKCVDVVRSGVLGQITAVRNFCAMNDNSEGLDNPPDTDPPAGLDWEMWLGPAPKVPFNIGRFRDGMHRYFKDYVDSWLHELGPHIVDLPFWALELGCPLTTSASGGRYATTSIADVPDTLDVAWEFPDKVMTWTLTQDNAYNYGVGDPGSGRRLGIVFQGKDATLVCNYGLCQVLDRNGKPLEDQTYPKSVPDSPGHEREFLDSIKSRKECSCSFAAHLPMQIALNLAHLSLKLGRKLKWDAEKWEVVGDKEATELCTPQYRAPWKLPSL
ncbi:MAG TPA: Gfo/Idh/MocA family oxidoreductase [Chthonomonadaceae bacterium]|nr:Gfo/Idh/MocA family oxidoreductase [Chthonomonadaceae bacterium]